MTAVGYGRSGDGISGDTVGASFSVKRAGQNAADAFDPDDEGVGPAELFLWDFDDPNAAGDNFLGGESLGNHIETTLAGGDSGGPSFIDIGGQLQVFGVNTFGANFVGGPTSPLFDSAAGGMFVPTYAPWIDSVTVPEPGPSTIALIGLVILGVARRRSG